MTSIQPRSSPSLPRATPVRRLESEPVRLREVLTRRPICLEGGSLPASHAHGAEGTAGVAPAAVERGTAGSRRLAPGAPIVAATTGLRSTARHSGAPGLPKALPYKVSEQRVGRAGDSTCSCPTCGAVPAGERPAGAGSNPPEPDRGAFALRTRELPNASQWPPDNDAVPAKPLDHSTRSRRYGAPGGGRLTDGSARGLVALAVFKTVAPCRCGTGGGFDSHALPPPAFEKGRFRDLPLRRRSE